MSAKWKTALMLFCLSVLFSGCVRYAKWDDGWKADYVGSFRLTVYWLAHQRYFRGAKRAILLHRGRVLARVPKAFARAIRRQGSGRLWRGRIVQYLGRCRWRGHYCIRVRKISSRFYPSGVGAAGVRLRPFRSVAAARHFRFGTRFYIPHIGYLLRRRGRTHNGCVAVLDRGGGITGYRLDLFTGNRFLYRRYLRGRLPRYVRVYRRHPKCRGRRGLRR